MQKFSLTTSVSHPNLQRQHCAAIHQQCIYRSPTIRCGNFTTVSDADLKLLFALYDETFFAGALATALPHDFSFSFSRRMTRAAGKIVFDRRRGPRRITLSAALLFQSFADIDRTVTVAGIPCHDRLEAAMRILEHELVHLIEFFLHGTTNCRQARFKKIASDLFGHTESAHHLVSQRERAAVMFQIRIGDRVRFSLDGRQITGIVHRITRRATVMVASKAGDYIDSKGTTYRKCYVPVALLTPE